MVKNDIWRMGLEPKILDAIKLGFESLLRFKKNIRFFKRYRDVSVCSNRVQAESAFG
jgi:AraC-like DNA-binding protein